MTKFHITVPKETYDRRQNFESKEFQVTFINNTVYLWLVAQATPPDLTEFEVESDSVPGSLPVACCATQWDASRNQPTYSSAVMIDLLSVQRQPGRLRVRVRITRGEIGTSLIAIGCTFAI